MTLRFSLPRVRGCGAGLGNELIPWARSYLAAQILGAYALKPAFGLNARNYWKHFGTPRYDWMINKGMECLFPVIEFKESDYLHHGGGNFVEAFQEFAEAENLYARKSYILVTEGMWGGYRHIAAARDFVFATLNQSRFAANNLLLINQRLNRRKTIVAMHVRLGDFVSADANLDAYRGSFNKALPLSWYRNIAKSISVALKDQVQFLIVSDGTDEQLKPLTVGFDAVTTFGIPDSDCSDLIALAQADLLVCSVSSYSAWAAFLSDSPYIWFEPNLQKHKEGFYSIWGHEPSQQALNGATKANIDKFSSESMRVEGRGVPVGFDGVISVGLIENLLSRKTQNSPESDLVQYGVVSS